MVRRLTDPDDPYHEKFGALLSYENHALLVSLQDDRARPRYVPAAVGREVLLAYHDRAGHPGSKETTRAVSIRISLKNYLNMPNSTF